MEPATATVLGSLILGTLTALALWRRAGEKTKDVVGGSILIGIAVTIFVSQAAMGLLTKTVKSDTLLLDNTGQTIKYYSHPTNLWVWSNEWKQVQSNILIVGRKEIVKVGMRASPITENPKVRELRYTVEVSSILGPEGIKDYYEEIIAKKDTPKEYLQRLLYDFNERYSSELSEFWNPLRNEQQHAFSEMVRSFLQPHLEKAGLRFENASFQLP